MISSMISSALGFVGMMFIIRYLGYETYGTIQWALSLVATFNAISDLGFNSAHIKRVSEGRDINQCVSTFLVIKIFLTVLMAALIFVSLFIWTDFLGYPLEDTSAEILTVFVLYHVFYDMAHIATFTFEARLEQAKARISMIMDPLVRVPLVIMIALNGLDDLTLSYAYAIGGLCFSVVALSLLAREHLSFRRPLLLRSYLIFAVPIAMISIMSALSYNMDKIIIGYFWTNVDVGYYTAAQRLAELLSIIGMAVSSLTFPAFSMLHSNGQMDAVREKTRQAERYIAMIALPIILVIILFPSEVATILLSGTGVENVGEPLRFLAWATLFNLLNVIYASQVNAVNRPDITAKLTFLSVIINILFLLILVPASVMDVELAGLAETGAAIAKLIAVLVLFLSTRYIVYRLTGTATNPRLLLQIPAAAIAGAALFSLSGVWEMSRWWDLVGYGLVSFGVFAAVLAILKELRKSDIEFLMDVLNPVKMLKYIISEFRR